MANYLTQQDVENYGSELLDVSQRAALNAVTPYLQQLNQQNADLRSQVAREQRRALDERVASLVPDYQSIDADPAWHKWLLGIDLMSGRIRQALLNEAIRTGNARRVQKFFDDFRRQGQSTSSPTSRGRSAAKQIYNNDLIKQLYEQHRKGQFTEPQWNRIEADIFAAQREGRVQARPFLTK